MPPLVLARRLGLLLGGLHDIGIVWLGLLPDRGQELLVERFRSSFLNALHLLSILLDEIAVMEGRLHFLHRQMLLGR